MARLPDATSVVVRTPLIPQSASAADPRLVYGPPRVVNTAGLTPSYLPNQGGQPVYMPYSSATGQVEASNGQPGEGTDFTEPTLTPTMIPTMVPGAAMRVPQYVLLPAPVAPPMPLYQSPTVWLALAAAVICICIFIILSKRG